jgi:hypothetical protein
MNSRTDKNSVRAAGAILGIGLALALLIASRPGADASPLPATLRVAMAPVGELEVAPSLNHPVFVAHSLMPGRPPASGSLRIRNQTGSALAVGLRTSVDSTALDGLVRIRLSVDGRPLVDTTVQGMGQRPVGLRLESGARARLDLEVWIPSDILSGYEGRLVNMTLAPQVHPIGGRG